MQSDRGREKPTVTAQQGEGNGRWSSESRVQPSRPGGTFMTPPVAVSQRKAPALRSIEALAGAEYSAPGSAVQPPGQSERERRPVSRTALLLWTVTIVGVVIRVRGLTSGGLRTSDAWVALTTKVGLGEAWHMFANAPGFYFLEREWLQLYPGATWWGQLPAFVMGVAAIPAIYALFRYLRFDPWVQLVAAFVVAVSPICIIYSGRDKEYSADFLVACLLIAAAEQIRRHWRPSDIRNLAIITVLSFVLSGSTLPVIIAVWVAVGIHGWRSGRSWRSLLKPALPAIVACLMFDRLFYGHLSPYLNRSWHNNFISHASPLAFIDSVGRIIVTLYQGMTGSVLNGAIVFVLLTGLALLGLRRGAVNLSSVLVVGAALVACSLRIIPLGTGRTDEVLYPAFLLLIGSGLQSLARSFTASVSGKQWHRWCVAAIGVTLMSVLFLSGVATENHYDNKDVKPLAAEVMQQFHPGDHIVVDAMLRYSWALYVDQSPHIELGENWMPGFTVTSTQPTTFIVPSFAVEGDWHPQAWTQQLAHYQRLWLIEPAFGAHPSLQPQPTSFYAALYGAGWHPTRDIVGTGAVAILLQR